MENKYYKRIGLILFLGLLLFLTFNRHSKPGYFNYRSEIWADKAGYYVYLPATLKYSFNAANFPDSIDHKTGDGFTLDLTNGKVITKYTCGVALMQLPFYLLADLTAPLLNQKQNGFAPIYHWAINVAAVSYLLLGLYFLYSFLVSRFDHKSSLLTVLTLFLGTNLYYYSIDETGMSHVYSFSLFCILLYVLQRTNLLKNINIKSAALYGLLIGLIILIRPTNILFLSVLLLLDIDNLSEIISRLKKIFKLNIIIPIVGVSIIVISPQLLYWNYKSGSLINYSYQNEGFNWLNPKLINLWFEPNNGLFLYTPIYFLFIATLIYLIKHQIKNGLYVFILFVVISYVFSSWWFWSFGCSFGSRSYVEYLSIFSIPLTYLFYHINNTKLLYKISVYLFILFCIAYNFKMTYSYDGCFYNNSDWDWNAFIILVTSPTK